MRDKHFWDIFYMSMAERVADLSRDHKTKVGCVIAKDDNVISYSYNGTPRGTDNTMRDVAGKTLNVVLHAETNAIGKVAKSHVSTRDATLYSTLSPCINCAKMIYQAGITDVVYRDLHDPEVLDRLIEWGISVRRVNGRDTRYIDPSTDMLRAIDNLSAKQGESFG